VITWKGKEKIDNLQSPLNTVAVIKGPKIENVIIAMHGFGDTASNFSSLAKEIDINNVLWLFPEAPRNVPMNMGGSQWFSLFEDPNKEIKNSENFLFELCHNVVEQTSIPMEKIFVMGFSQGASMALSCGLKLNKQLAGIIALSGFMMQQIEIKNALSEENKSIPIFLAHGQQDQVVLPAFFYETRTALKHMGFTKLTSKIYSMGHQVSGEELFGIKKFIEEHRS
jgi:predicted esterase